MILNSTPKMLKQFIRNILNSLTIIPLILLTHFFVTCYYRFFGKGTKRRTYESIIKEQKSRGTHIANRIESIVPENENYIYIIHEKPIDSSPTTPISSLTENFSKLPIQDAAIYSRLEKRRLQEVAQKQLQENIDHQLPDGLAVIGPNRNTACHSMQQSLSSRWISIPQKRRSASLR